MNIPYVMRKCSKCGSWLVASEVNFQRGKGYKYGLRSECKECCAKYKKRYRENNKEKIAEKQRQYRENNKEKAAEYHKQWQKDNRDKLLEYKKQYRESNNEKLAEYFKEYYQNNKEKIIENQKRYQQSPKGQVVTFNNCQRRRIKEEQLGSGITTDQWLECMSFFDWRCAYSGERLTKETRSVDHIVPLDAGGDNMVWNMVPMARNLNSSKNNKEMLEWYREQSFFSEARLAKIYEWQEYAYNKWGKDTEYFNTNDIQISLI